MAGRLHELKGSGDFTSGPSGTNGKIAYLAIGYESQSEAHEAALIASPEVIGSIPRGSISVTTHSPKMYGIEVEYAGGVRPAAEATAGQSPPPGDTSGPPGTDSTPSNRPDSPPRQASELCGAELSFSTSGATERIYISKRTRHAIGRADVGAIAPDFHRLIGVSNAGIAGCEVVARQTNFTVSRRFPTLQLGYFTKLLNATATTNKQAFCGFPAGSVLFYGADGGYKQGDTANPWSVSGKFGMSPNRNAVDIDDDPGNLRFPDVLGWNYIWTYNEKTTESIGGITYEIERPKFAYCEQVYDESDFKVLMMDF